MNEGISRRNFIGGAALGGAALALGALAGCAPQGDKPTGSEGTWDAEVDLLVCGCGGAGSGVRGAKPRTMAWRTC